jgi:intracellular septation protein A
MAETLAAVMSRPMLVARGPGETMLDDLPLPRLPILGAVVRQAMPRMLEASLIPNALFLVALSMISAAAAMFTVIVWTASAVVRRLLRRDPVPGVLVLAVAGLMARTAVALWSGSAALYFVQPILTTVVIGFLFVGSVLIGRPIVGRIAGDFCPMCPEVKLRPNVRRLFRQLTYVWAGVYLVTSLLTAILLVTAPLPLFVAVKTIGCLAITFGGVTLTVLMSLRTARREGLVFAARVVGAVAVPPTAL